MSQSKQVSRFFVCDRFPANNQKKFKASDLNEEIICSVCCSATANQGWPVLKHANNKRFKTRQ